MKGDTYTDWPAGQLRPEKMITAKIKLGDAVDKGFQELIDHRDRHCKILIDAQAS
jgi:threonine dehydrogenase-like Zn-dependent dehydrogenase